MSTDKTKIPISGKQLAKRWGMDPIDIFFIMLNHDLEVLGLWGNTVDAYAIIDATSRSDDKHLNPEKWSFVITDVQILEEQEFTDLPQNRANLIRGTALLRRLEIDEGDLFLFVMNGDLFPVDPLGSPIKWELVSELLEKEMLWASDLLFLLPEIEQFETDYSNQLSERKRVIATKKFPSVLETERGDIPKISFYKNGDNWIVGEHGKEMPLKDLKGFEIISLLIRHEGTELDVVFLDRLGKSPVGEADIVSGHVPDGVQLSHKMLLDDREYGDAEEPNGLRFSDDASSNEVIDDLSRESIENEIENIKERIETETNQLEIAILMDNLEKLKKYLSDAQTPSNKPRKIPIPENDNCRTNVKNRIKLCIKKIERSNSVLAQYLNKETIKTGIKCIYKQDESKKVIWILDPP